MSNTIKNNVLDTASIIFDMAIRNGLIQNNPTYDNAMAETINGLYKAEVIHRRGSWKTIEQVELETLDWVHWYNNRRLMEPLGYVSPAVYEMMYYEQEEGSAVAAGLN